MARHKANSHGARVGKGGLTDQMAKRTTKGGKAKGGKAEESTSIFDPVLAELAYKWFCPPAGTILDPFAGGSVRGVVAALLGYDYLGIDLRPEQIDANRVQADMVLTAAEGQAEWLVGDSVDVLQGKTKEYRKPDGGFDMVFTCPPYADLEVYSDDPRDISNMPYATFFRVFMKIMAMAAQDLAPNRFLVVVVGDARDKKTGAYYGFPAHVVSAMQKIGLTFHNEMILLTPPGSLPGRAKTPMEASRKVGRAHQLMLVFAKGSPNEAARAIGTVEWGDGDPLNSAEDLIATLGG